MDVMSDAEGEAEDAVMALPAPNVQALQWKLERILASDGDGNVSAWATDYVQPVLDDVRRLARQKRH